MVTISDATVATKKVLVRRNHYPLHVELLKGQITYSYFLFMVIFLFFFFLFSQLPILTILRTRSFVVSWIDGLPFLGYLFFNSSFFFFFRSIFEISFVIKTGFVLEWSCSRVQYYTISRNTGYYEVRKTLFGN